MKITRRSILKMGSAFGALSWSSSAQSAPTASQAHHSSQDPWLEIRSDHLRHNVREIGRHVARPILAVIKNNGYGLGVSNVARVLEPLTEVAGFAVVKAQAAMKLRNSGIRKPILLMGPFDETNLTDLIRRDIMPMVYTPIGEMLDRVSAKLQKKIPLHICVDTGLGRIGVPVRQAEKLIHDLAGRRSIQIKGVMMTFVEDAELDKEQLHRFNLLCQSLKSQEVPIGRKHAASSYALFDNPQAFLDMVRPGMALYGIYPDNKFLGTDIMDLRPALSLKARVIYVKKIRQGDNVGYNRAYEAPKDTWIATMPVGHADGLPRVAAKGVSVRIGSELYPLVGTVSASHCMADLGTAEPRVKIGDVVTVFDWQEGSRPENVSEACGASVYDLTMHLSPLLPKRIINCQL